MALNCVIAHGRLVTDPQLRTVTADRNVCHFRIAVDRDYVNKASGERGTDFLDVVAWGNTGNFVAQYFAKGDAITVKGRLESRNWEDKDQNKRTSIEINAENVYFGAPKKTGGEAPRADQPRQQDAYDDDEELPF